MITRRQFHKLALTTAAVTLPTTAFAKRSNSPGKRGCCFVTKEGSNWQRNVDLLKPDWMYSWGLNRPEELASEIEFVPMFWGAGKKEGRSTHIQKLQERIETGTVKSVLGFNEPDQKSQSNIPVEKALEIWPEFMELDVPLVGPACVHPDNEWILKFMEEANRRDLRVDAVAVHSYAGASPLHFLKRLESIHRRFGKPLWITEFAVGDWNVKDVKNNRHKPDKIARYMKDVLPVLDELSYVEKYSWFSAKPSNPALGTSALIDEEGELTKLGKIYANYKR